jgi:hypothetical protein
MTKAKLSEYSIEAKRIAQICKELKGLPYKPNLTTEAIERGCDYGKLWRAYQGHGNKCTRKQGNKALDDAQELALKLFLDHIDRIGFGICSEMVRDAANSILA